MLIYAMLVPLDPGEPGNPGPPGPPGVPGGPIGPGSPFWPAASQTLEMTVTAGGIKQKMKQFLLTWVTVEISHYKIWVYLVLQGHHPGQVHREVLGFQLDLENLGNLELLYLQANLEYLILEDRGLPLRHLNQGIL